MISEPELQALLKDTESTRAERTVSITREDKFCEAICAFANDLENSCKPGYLWVGAKDDGTLSGFRATNENLTYFGGFRDNGNILPIPSLNVCTFNFSGGDVLVVEVQPSPLPPVRYRGNVWIRTGPRRAIASETEERSLLERRVSHTRTFDATPCLESSIHDRLISHTANNVNAQLVLIDVGPNLGAINRAVLTASNFVCVPLSPDLFSLVGLRNLGPTLKRWREEGEERKSKFHKPSDVIEKFTIPADEMKPIGFIVMQHAIRNNSPAKAYQKWLERVPDEYKKHIEPVDNGPYELAMLRHYRSLAPMSMEARKPMFDLKPADGAIGAHQSAVQDSHKDFENLAKKLASVCEIQLDNLE